MNDVLEKMFTIYKQMTGQSDLSDQIKDETTQHVKALVEAGEVDTDRLTVSGLTFMKRREIA